MKDNWNSSTVGSAGDLCTALIKLGLQIAQTSLMPKLNYFNNIF